MKLVVPYVDEMQPADCRLARLAEFLGVEWEPLPLARHIKQHAEYIQRALPDQRSCFVVNPRVMREWIGGDTLPADLVSCLLSGFPRLVVHALRQNLYDSNAVAALSRGRVHSVHAVDGANTLYEIAKDSRDICGAFSGLSFGPTNPANDRVLSCSDGEPAVRNLISIDGRPFMAVLKQEGTEVFFLAGEDIADLDAEVDDAVDGYFSRLVPHVMILRHIFCECWRPYQSHASVVLDDVLLRPNYGFLNFEFLLGLMKRHGFHTTVAFIPHNFRRSSPQITRMLRENSACFALSFHGNDHTAAEFASADKALLNTMLHIAKHRMRVHHEITGLDCDKVMVFPQGNFSVEAMRALKCHNFYAAVNTVPHPRNQPSRLTIRDLAQPAVLRYGGFPLFTRNTIQQTQSHHIAFNVFFGKPILIVGHHDIFQHPGLLTDAVSRINTVAPEIHWTNLANVVSNSILRRRTPDGTQDVRAYSGTVRLSNDSDFVERFSIGWNCFGDRLSVEHILRNLTPVSCFDVEDGQLRLLVELPPGDSQTFSVVYRNENTGGNYLGWQWNAKAFIRRRLSEVRDNYLSKNARVLAVAKTLQRGILN